MILFVEESSICWFLKYFMPLNDDRVTGDVETEGMTRSNEPPVEANWGPPS